MKISRLFNNLPKRLFAGFLLSLAIFLPIATSAASAVKIEGSMGVANVTAGDTTYGHSVNASYNQVVKLQVYYHNTELPDSGKVAQNLRVKINIPTAAGKVQTQTATISADNSNTVTSSTQVNLDRSDASLQYIPGSAVWRHNVGTNDNIHEVDTTVSDNIVNGGTGLVLEDEKPCYNFSATVTVLARVIVPGVSVNKQVRVKGSTNWATSVNAVAGNTVQYLISYKNTGNSEENNVVIGDKLPTGVTYIPGTTKLFNDSTPNGKSVADGVTTSGIVIGSYAPGTNAYVEFDAKLPTEGGLSCGNNLFRNIASAQPQGMNYYYNTADVNVKKACTPNTPVYSCNLLTLMQGDNRSVKATVTYTAKNGATYQSTSYSWGDGTTSSTGNHTYGKDGTYKVVANVTFAVNGSNKTVTGPGCQQTITVKTPPKGTPVYSCNMLTISQDDSSRTVTASVNYTAQNGASFKTVTLDWGDSTTPLTTSNTTSSHTYAADGNYTISARVLFSVNGKDVYGVDNANCVKQVNFTTPSTPGTPGTPSTPGELPNTGAGNVIGIAIGAIVAGTIAGRLFLSRKFATRR